MILVDINAVKLNCTILTATEKNNYAYVDCRDLSLRYFPYYPILLYQFSLKLTIFYKLCIW